MHWIGINVENIRKHIRHHLLLGSISEMHQPSKYSAVCKQTQRNGWLACVLSAQNEQHRIRLCVCETEAREKQASLKKKSNIHFASFVLCVAVDVAAAGNMQATECR